MSAPALARGYSINWGCDCRKFGRGSEPHNLRRMVEFAQVFPNAAIVSSLSTQLPQLNAALVEARGDE